MPSSESLAVRLFAKVQVLGSGCWEWTGSTRRGYGQIWTSLDARGQRRLLAAHRASYELALGPIPEGLELDHLCRNTLCVNSAHLEPVTHKVNLLRGRGPTAENARKTHCSCGEALRPHPDGWAAAQRRYCPACEPVGGRLLTLKCRVCAGPFVARKSTARCCSNPCRRRLRLAALAVAG